MLIINLVLKSYSTGTRLAVSYSSTRPGKLHGLSVQKKVMKRIFVLTAIIATTISACNKEAIKPSAEVRTAISYSDANIAIADFKAEKTSEAIRISFKTMYERNIKEIEVLSGTTQTHLCSIYREMKNENSTQTQTYSIADTAAENAIMYYLIKYTASNGDWAFTPVYKCRVQQ
ncbi:MAG: hypothetical protein ACTHJ5_15415 [Ilyomonas sp.]